MSAISDFWPFALFGTPRGSEGTPTNGDIPDHAIPISWAASLCEDICRESANQNMSRAHRCCARCMELYPREVNRRGFARRADNRGCPFINAREAHYYWAFHG